MIRKFLTAAALLLTLAVMSGTADAYNCTTTCYGSGGYRTCNTNCW